MLRGCKPGPAVSAVRDGLAYRPPPTRLRCGGCAASVAPPFVVSVTSCLGVLARCGPGDGRKASTADFVRADRGPSPSLPAWPRVEYRYTRSASTASARRPNLCQSDGADCRPPHPLAVGARAFWRRCQILDAGAHRRAHRATQMIEDATTEGELCCPPVRRRSPAGGIGSIASRNWTSYDSPRWKRRRLRMSQDALGDERATLRVILIRLADRLRNGLRPLRCRVPNPRQRRVARNAGNLCADRTSAGPEHGLQPANSRTSASRRCTHISFCRAWKRR